MKAQTLWRPLQLLCVVALVVGIAGVPGAATPRAIASDTPNPTRVTVPGSLGSELGCTATSSSAGGDWEPGCNSNPGVTPATPNPPEGNDLLDRGNSVWSRELGPLPAGTYEYKVALNGNWAENYGSNFQKDGPNFSLTLAAERSVRFYYDHKTHFITNNATDTIYTLPGEFNSELECSGDWDPACLRTLMSDVDGDGTFTFSTSAIPAGTYQFKVAENEAWTTSYGDPAGPGGNAVFTVPAGGIEVIFSFNATTKAVSAQVQAPPPAEDAALLRAPVSDPANQDEVFYFVMPDRFANGSAANDRGGIAGDDPLVHGYLPTDKGYYHGGDLKGLTERIDYIQSLGVTAIWMTPSFKNKPVQCDRTKEPSVANCSAAYHGYWPVDFTQMDPHFGTNAEMKAFVAAANARGMRVFFDIITNHTADVIDSQGSYVTRVDSPYRDAGGNIIDDRDYLFAEAFPELNRYSFPRRPAPLAGADATAKNPAWLNDPTMYHNRGEIKFDGTEAETYGDFVGGLDDLFTERPEVVDGLLDIHKFWIEEFGIDGFRVDTVKHVNMEFWQQFVPEIRAHAAANGKPDFFIFGEVFSGDPAFMARYTREGRFPATLDFDFNYSGQDFAVGSAGPARLAGLFRGDDYYTTPEDNAYNQPTFLGNHDVGRFANRMQRVEGDIGSDQERVSRMLLGYGLMFTARGVPIIYYGDEQGFTGDGGDKDARQSLFASQVASYNDDDLIGTDSTTAVDNYNQSHPLYVGLQQLAALRKAHPALQNGAQIERLAESANAGVYAFSRIDRAAKVEYVVALNNAEQERTVAVQTFAPQGASFQPIYGPVGANLTTNAAGQLSVTVPALGMVVYKQTAANPGNPGGSQIGPAISLTAPAGGTVLPASGLVEVAATVGGNVFAEVSFAVSVNGGAYQPLGTDTNAPYRVFYDVGKAPAGAELSFKAVVTDLLGAQGNFNSATAVVSTGIPPVCTVDYEYAVVHYYRPDGNYDGWKIHPFGDGISGTYDYNTGGIPFLGRTEYGAFAWIPLTDASKQVGMVIHNNADGTDEKDPNADLFFTPADTPQVFIKSGDTTVYPSQAAAQGYITIHYNRPDGNYAGWGAYVFGDGVDPSDKTTWPANNPFIGPDAGEDAFGRYVRIKVTDATKELGFIIQDGADPATKDTDPDRFILPATSPSVWIKSGDTRIYRSLSEAEGVVTLRYHRPAGDYGNYASNNFNDFWGLHTWAGTKVNNGDWTTPFKPVGPPDSFGVTFRTELAADATQWAYILHRGDAKDKPSDQFLNLAETGNEIWILQEMPGAYPYLLPVEPGCRLGQGNISAQQRAHFVSRDTIAWPIVASPEVTYRLHAAPNGGMSFANGDVQGAATTLDLTLLSGHSDATRAKFPHLADLTALRLPADADVKALLKGQLWVSARTQGQGVVEVTGLQIPGALDDLYAAAAASQQLGPRFAGGNVTFKLWAPTAQDVNLLLFPTAAGDASTTVEMTFDAASGVWSATRPASIAGQYYLYEVKVFVPSTGAVETNRVTDPYSVSLATNSARSQAVDLSSAALKPAGWDSVAKPRLDAFEDVVLYELHVRDFSITDETVPEEQRGTFKAFTQRNSAGMRHLRALADAGLTHIHLLPAFDIATINEDASQREELLGSFDELRGMAPDGEEQQAAAAAVRDKDGFNWGYDPYHYNVPEGSYSTNPEGATRVVEFREMVRSLNRNGLRVVMDVVYNHTNAAGQAEKSVLDKVVPGYYHRLNAEGGVETSTCCPNTATEHDMMRKLMVDSVVLWATQYKVDGFRFDLMGHHMKADMLAVREALDSLTLARDGVDGSKIVLYGEGWNFGEVVDGRRGVNATQRNLPGTGIATFSDRLRDAVRGGGPFDSGEGARKQGFINGLFTDPNGLDQGDQQAALLRSADMIRLGMAGNLASYSFTNSAGQVVRGEDVDYNGSPAGYTRDPQEVITYIEAHDNETLFDAIQLKAPATATITDRVRMQNLGISIVMLGQGIPFFQAGQEFLRSKSGDRNSYDSGDWFNRVDWTLEENNWGSGLPPERENSNNWGVLRPVLAQADLKPGRTQMVGALTHFQELLQIRKSSPLFRLRTAEQVNSQLSFLNTGAGQIPGLIVMRLADPGTGALDLDPLREQIVVLVNAADEPVTFTAAALAGSGLKLHEVQAFSGDAALAGASFNDANGTFVVPARTTLVYDDRPQGGPQQIRINYSVGAPGSAFVVTGKGFAPNAALTITVNGRALAGTFTADATGTAVVTIQTAERAQPGLYQVEIRGERAPTLAQVAPLVLRTAYVLDPFAPQRALAANAPAQTGTVPVTVAAGYRLYLPIVSR
jgi:pullulanase-type alpha-1,6-glucosidase